MSSLPPPTLPPPPPPIVHVDRTPSLLVMGGAAVVVIGATLPWLTLSAPIFGSMSRNGFDYGDGTLLTVAAVVAGLFGLGVLCRWGGQATAILACLAGVALIAASLYDYHQLNNRIAAARSGTASGLISVTLGNGIRACVAGSVAVTLGGFLAARALHVRRSSAR